MQVSATMHLCCGLCWDNKPDWPSLRPEMDKSHGYAASR
jgi:hypothetical protein